MLKLGLIGYPLAHSLSPAMHKAALANEGIKGDYVLLGTPPEKLENMVNFLKKGDFRGFNVTIPHKVAIMDYLDSIDKLALQVGAVNTVIIEDNKRLTGHNTDVFGFMYAIPDNIRESLNGKKAVVLGSGGAARAVTAGLAELGIAEIQIITLESEFEKAREIESILNNNYRRIKTGYREPGEKIELEDVDIVVNSTPVGMEGNFIGVSPLSSYSLDTLPENAFVYDIVYKPQKTKLLELAEKRGLSVLGGLDMLVLQGKMAFHLWTGVEPSAEVMRSAIV